MAKVMAISNKEYVMSPVELLSHWSFGGVDWLVIGVAIALAYIVFGIAGFGTALVAGPILILFMPLSKIIPCWCCWILSRPSATFCNRAGMW